MNALTIGRVIYHNFLCFKHAEFDFSQSGLTVIEGEARDTFGCSNNGAGKSAAFDGVSWCLFDRSLRPKYSGDDLVRLEWKGDKLVQRSDGDGTYVEVDIIGGPHSIRVRRYRKDPTNKDRVYLWLGGKDVSRGTNAQTTLAIEQAIGLDFTAFTNSVAFGVREDVAAFLASSDGDRKQLLEKLLGLGIYADAQRLASADLKVAAEALNRLESDRLRIDSGLAEQRRVLIDAQSAPDGNEDTLQLQIQREKIKINSTKGALEKVKARLDDERQRLARLEDTYAARRKDYENATKEHAKQANAAAHAERIARTEVGKATAHLSTIDRRIQSWDDLAGKECPTCSQEVGEELVESITTQLASERSEYEAEKLKADEIAAAAAAKREAAEKLKAEPPEDITIDTRSAIRADEAEAAKLQAVVNASVATLKAWESAKADHAARLQGILNRIIELEKDLSAAERKLIDQNRLVDDLAFWVEGFGNSGMKSFLIEAELPEINRRATVYAQRLLGAGTRIKINATRQLKTKDVTREEMSIDVVIPRCTRSYAGASKGQKHRLNLAVLLACRDLVSSRSAKSFRQLFADELFDGLDATGCKVVVEVLRAVVQDCPVALVTHDNRIKTAADRLVTMRHENGVTELIAHHAGGDKPRVQKGTHGGTKPPQGQ
jgi:DNA repair exonuclease SbcCD ATPase subunit